MRNAKIILAVLTTSLLGGCGASLPSLSTGSLFGSKPATPPVVQNDPTSRAIDVGVTSARAIKCGYNFDPAKLRNQFLTAEQTANPTSAANLPQVYDTAFNGVSKAVAQKGSDYCSPAKTARIKTALTRHLAGDYTPSPPEPVEEEEGLFGGMGGASADGHGANMQDMMN